MPTAVEVNPVPGPGWNATGAFSFPSIWSTVAKYRAPDSALSTSMFVTVFFEETACCNMLQQGTPVAVGPGQFQVSEDIGVRFFSSPKNFLGLQLDSSRTLYGVRKDLTVFKRTKQIHPELQELTTSRVLSDNDFSVKMHIKMFEWIQNGLSDGKQHSRDGLLSAQTGNNATAMDGFRKGSTALDQLMAPDSNARPGMSNGDRATYIQKRRSEWVQNLNIARRGFRGNPIPEKQFAKFWEFFLPDDFLIAPAGYIAHGF
jgi:hypothetical protein